MPSGTTPRSISHFKTLLSSPTPTPSSGRSDERAEQREKGLKGVPKLFHLRCSPRPASESAAGAETFITRFRQLRPSWDIDVMDIWRETLPEFEGDVLEAKYARQSGREFSNAQRDAFAMVERMAMRFALADRVLISTPM